MKKAVHSLLLLVACAAAAGVPAADVGDLVVARAGDLPIVITAPHGGQNVVPGARPRTSGVLTTDARTLELAEALAGRLKEILGAEPYFVAARFQRLYIDANRSEAEAFEDANARTAYAAYHGRIREFVDAVRKRYPSGALLLDIHGQSTDPDTVHRGTQNGGTVASLLRKHGLDALQGEKSVLGALRARGHAVFPANTPLGNPRENRLYNGGFTVQAYGSNRPDGIDAIQLELGANVRRMPRLADDLAEAVAVYYRTYLAGPR